MPTTLIDRPAALDAFIEQIDTTQALAVDTEFFRETTYYPQLGLVQLASGNQVALVDPLAFDALPRLGRLLLDAGITKLFHSCSQDLEVLLHELGGLCCPLQDTQVAAALLQPRDQISYADLVADITGVELEKSQTRTNWLRRPLSRKQQEYAAEDVLYLHPVHDHLLEQLDKANRIDWFEHECARLCASAQRFEPDYENCWLRVKGTQRLEGVELAIVDALARWRERCAVALDLTRRRVMHDDAIVSAALQPPTSRRALRDAGKLTPRLGDADLDDALAAIDTARDSDPASWPVHPRARMDAERKTVVRSLMTAIENTAGELGLAQAMLASRKEIERLVDGKRDLDVLQGWRRDVIGDRLLAMLG